MDGADQSTDGHQQEAQALKSPSAKVVHDSIYKEAVSELSRSSANLFWSGLAAGLSMGFSLIAEGLLRAYLPDAHWQHLVSNFGYSLGFLIVILGKQQLFTENTLTPILPLLHKKSLSTLLNVLRLWAVVLLANLLGTAVIAFVSVRSTLFDPAVQQAFAEIGQQAIAPEAWSTFLRAVFAGWLIALMVWLIPYAETARVWVIIIITYIVGVGHFSHIIAGSVETFGLIFMDKASWEHVLIRYTLPTLAGNILGGVIIVAALNHAQITAGK